MNKVTKSTRNLVPVWLFILDGLMLWFSFNIVHKFRLSTWVDSTSWVLYALIVLVILTLYVADVYRIEFSATISRLPLRAMFGVGFAAAILALFIYLLGPEHFMPLFGRGVLPGTLFLFAVWAGSSRYLASKHSEDGRLHSRWLCIGDDEQASLFINEFRGKGENSGTLEVIDENHVYTSAGSKSAFVVESEDRKENRQWTAIIVASDKPLSGEMATWLMKKRLKGTRVYDLTEFYETFWSRVPVFHLKDGWFVYSRGFDLLHHQMGIRMKRILDVIFAFLGLILTLPFILLAGILVIVESRGPMFYTQLRTGVNGREFKIYKLRSMVSDAEKDGIVWTKQHDPRVTMVGKVLRAIRLDELPQLWNVLRGDMSFVGPRPERPVFNQKLEEQIPYYDLRHLVKPGITGWAQVMYPYGASIEDARCKLEYDLYYIKNYSLILDVAIILKTFRVVLWGKGR